MTEQTFLEHIRGSGEFSQGAPVHVARAPGRLDVLGGIADYSGATVLEMPIAAATWAAAQRRDDQKVVLSTDCRESGFSYCESFPLEGWIDGYEAVRERFAGGPHRWAAYVAGTLTVLAQERGEAFSTGVTVQLLSNVPVGAGVSSSAALEVSSMAAIAAAYGIALERMELARLCQIVENRVVGAPCGIMDQVTTAMGRAGRLLALECRPATIAGHLRAPDGWRFVAIDSAVKHSIGRRAYARARVAAFMGWQMMRSADGSLPPGGYLANLTSAAYCSLFGENTIPESISGRAFLERHADWPDPVTRVDPDEDYPVRAATMHPILENESVLRVHCAMDARRDGIEQRVMVGREMLRSHARYSALGLGCPETDLIVEMVMARGPERGLYGARVTGGGNGGAVAILADDSPTSSAALAEIVEAYRAETGRAGRLISGTSDGAMAFGVREVRL